MTPRPRGRYVCDSFFLINFFTAHSHVSILSDFKESVKENILIFRIFLIIKSAYIVFLYPIFIRVAAIFCARKNWQKK